MSDPYISPQRDACALVTIDVQNDFTLPDAPARIAGTWEAMPALARTVAAFRAAGRPIIHVVRLYRPDGSNADACRRQLIEQGARLVHPGTSGAELVATLPPDGSGALDAELLLSGAWQELGPGEWALYKPRWSAFHATSLDARLREWGITTIVLVGCNFPNCPRATLYDASGRDYRLLVVPDAVSGLGPEGLRELAAIGVASLGSERIGGWLAGAGGESVRP